MSSVGEALKLRRQAQPIQFSPNESRPAQTKRAGNAMVGRPFHETTRHGLWISLISSGTLGQDMPDHHQQLARNGDNRFVPANRCGELGKAGFPIG